MTIREIVERSLVGVAAVTCLFARARARLLAGDVAAGRSALSEGDVAYRITARERGFWRARTIVPFHPRTGADRGPRTTSRCAGPFARLLRLDDPTVSLSDPHSRCFATTRRRVSTRSSREAKDPEQRSRAAGLLGVVGLARLVSETQDRVALLSATVANLQLAVALDPDNDEAKYNLELALQRARGLQLDRGCGRPEPVARRKRFHGRGRRRSWKRLLDTAPCP